MSSLINLPFFETWHNLLLKPGFHYPSWRVAGFHYPSTRAVLTGARWRVMETGHPSTRAVNSGSGNRALITPIYISFAFICPRLTQPSSSSRWGTVKFIFFEIIISISFGVTSNFWTGGIKGTRSNFFNWIYGVTSLRPPLLYLRVHE